MKALLVVASVLALISFWLLHAIDTEPPTGVQTPRTAAKATWSSQQIARPIPPATVTDPAPPPPQLGDIAGTSAPLPRQLDAATMRARFARVKAVQP